jgi:hypothetical protein
MNIVKLREQLAEPELRALAASGDAVAARCARRFDRFARPAVTSDAQERFLFGATRAEICQREARLKAASSSMARAARAALALSHTQRA